MNTEIQIIQETLGLFRLYGIKSLTPEDIARLGKIPFRLLKRHFPTKESLLLKCVRFRISQEEIFKYTDDSLTDILLNFAEAYPVLYKNINQRCCLEIKKYYHSVYLFLYRYLEYYSIVCQHKTQEGITNGYIRRTTSPHLVYTFFKEHWIRLFTSDSNRIQAADSLRITQKTLTFAREIATPKGRIYIDNKLKNRIYDENN